MLQRLARTNRIYYLHPSFGDLFETFELQPHGVIYEMKLLEEDRVTPAKLAALAMELGEQT